MKELSHIDKEGKARMVDVGNKPMLKRTATATGFIQLDEDTLALIRDNLIRKGDVLTIAEIAGVMGAKKTSELIPLCHLLALDNIAITTQVEGEGIRVFCTASCHGSTGVEMEALTGISVALLTIYDMCKAVCKTMVINDVKLLNKTKQPL
jgi:cyclic pyranopterin monophosphate synthase